MKYRNSVGATESARSIARASSTPTNDPCTKRLGADSVVSGRAGAATLAVRLAGRVSLRPGDRLDLAWDPEELHCFDPVSQRRREDWRVLLMGALSEASSGGLASERHEGPAA